MNAGNVLHVFVVWRIPIDHAQL